MIGWLGLIGWVGSGVLGFYLTTRKELHTLNVGRMTGGEAALFLFLFGFYAVAGPVGLLMGLLALWEHRLTGR